MHDKTELESLREQVAVLMREHKGAQARRRGLRRVFSFGAVMWLALGATASWATVSYLDGAPHVPSTIPYEGYLELGGVPANSSEGVMYHFRIALVSCSDVVSPETCEPIWENYEDDDSGVEIEVRQGRFATLLGPLELADIQQASLHVRVEVRPNESAEFVSLGLQAIHSVPYAVATATQPPVGAIIGWHRDISPGSPLLLPSGWAPCDGQTLVDPQSLFDGMALPNLNADVYSGTGRGHYLRGGATSGGFNGSTRRTLPDSPIGGLVHSEGGAWGAGYAHWANNENAGYSLGYSFQDPHPDGDASYTDTAVVMQVAAMTVVYIMRVK